MRIIGIDPAINNTGWAILEKINNKIIYIASGVIKTKPSNNLAHRLGFIADNLTKIIDIYSPNYSSIEEIFLNSNPKSSITLSHARGAILSLMGQKQIPVLEFTPNKIKKTIVGNGKADKIQVQKMLNYVIENVKFTNSDESDAIAIGYTAFVHIDFYHKF